MITKNKKAITNQKIIIIILTSITLVLAIMFANMYLNQNNMNYQNNNLNTENQINENINIIKTISPKEFKSKVDSSKYTIIDVRTPQEFNSGHIKGALNVNYYNSNFKRELNKLDKNKKYLFYCQSGHRSSKALEIAKELNFKEVYDMQGGIINWYKNQYPLVK